MQVEIQRHALDRVPLSLIVDDSTMLINTNYFFMRDRSQVEGRSMRWQDVPVVHPESFTREFAEFCLREGVRGKFSVVPCPAALGRIDEGLPLFSRAQQESWLAMCRELIAPAFDITPEMLTHTVVVDPHTCKPLGSGLWEQYDWQHLPIDEEELVVDYIATACQILENVGLSPQGVTSPGGFGSQTLEFYARALGEGVRRVTGSPLPFFFVRSTSGPIVQTPLWHWDGARGTGVAEIIASTDDWTGSWTGYGQVDADRYIGADLQSGRLVELIDGGQPAILCSHWQGFYGMHDEDRRGFSALQQVVARLRERDPRGEYTRWRTCSEIGRYAACRQLAQVELMHGVIELELALLAPELTLCIEDVEASAVRVDGKPLRAIARRDSFASGTFLSAGGKTLLAFDPPGRHVRVEVE